jgi:hypothetical protein
VSSVTLEGELDAVVNVRLDGEGASSPEQPPSAEPAATTA